MRSTWNGTRRHERRHDRSGEAAGTAARQERHGPRDRVISRSRRTDVSVEETFTTRCTWCRSDTSHTRVRETEHHAFLGIRGPKTGLFVHVVRCAACGGQQHVRDLVSLDSPVLASRYAAALRSAIADLDLGPGDASARTAAISVIRPFDESFDDATLDRDRREHLGDELPEVLAELRENYHSSIHRRWLAAMIYVVDELPSGPDVIEQLARGLSMQPRDLDAAHALATPEIPGDREAG